MKPRIRLLHKVWDCGVPGHKSWVWGFGFTPKEAYDDWLRQLGFYRKGL